MKFRHVSAAALLPLIVASTATTVFGQLGTLSTSFKSPSWLPSTPVYSHGPIRLPDLGINGPKISPPNYKYTRPSAKKTKKGGIEIGTTTKTLRIPNQNTLYSGTLSDDPRINRDLINRMQPGRPGIGNVSSNPPKINMGTGPDTRLQDLVAASRRQQQHNSQMIQQSISTLGNLFRPVPPPTKPPGWMHGPPGGFNPRNFNPIQEINRGRQELQKSFQNPIVQQATDPATYDPGRIINVNPNVISDAGIVPVIPKVTTEELIRQGTDFFSNADDTLVDLDSQRVRRQRDAIDAADRFFTDADEQRVRAQNDLVADADQVLVESDEQRIKAQNDFFTDVDEVLVVIDQQRVRGHEDLVADAGGFFNDIDEALVEFDEQRVRAQDDLTRDAGSIFAGLEKNGRRAAKDFAGTRIVGALGNSISKHVTARAVRESAMGTVGFIFDPLGEISKNAPGARSRADYDRLAGEENEKRLKYGSIRSEAEILNEEGVEEETIQFIKRNNDGKWTESDQQLFSSRFEKRFEEEFVRWLDTNPDAASMSDDEFNREIGQLQEFAQQKALADVYGQYGLDSNGNALDKNGEPIIIAKVTESVLVTRDVFEPGYSGSVTYKDSEGNLQVDHEAVFASRGEFHKVKQWKMVTHYRRLTPEELEQTQSKTGFAANLTDSKYDKDYDNAFDPDYQYPDSGDDGPLPEYSPEPSRNDSPPSTPGPSGNKPKRPVDRSGLEYDRDDYTPDLSPGSRPDVSKKIKVVRNVNLSAGGVPKGTGLSKADLRGIAGRVMKRNRRRQSKDTGPQTSGTLNNNVVVPVSDPVDPGIGNGYVSPSNSNQPNIPGIYQYVNDPNLAPNNFVPVQQFGPLPLNPTQPWNPVESDRPGIRDGDLIIEPNPQFINDEYQDYDTGQYIPRNSKGVGIGIALGNDRPAPYRIPHNIQPTPTGDTSRTSQEFNSTFGIENEAAQTAAKHLIPNETRKGLTAVAKLPETVSSYFETRAEQKRRDQEQQDRTEKQNRKAKVKELFARNLKEREARGNYDVIPEQYIERYIDRPWYDRLMTLDRFYDRERKNDEAAATAKAASEQRQERQKLDEQKRIRQQEEQQRIQEINRRHDRFQKKLSNPTTSSRFETAMGQWEQSRKGKKWLSKNPRPEDGNQQKVWELERKTQINTEVREAAVEERWEKASAGRDWLRKNPKPNDPARLDRWEREKRNQSNTWNLFRPETSVSEGGIRAQLFDE